MITIPVYELLLLPEVTFFFKKDMFPEGRIKEQNIGEEILFVLQKKEIAPEEISMENIFPVGVMGIIENIDEEGSVKITTRKRVQVTHVEYTDGMVQAEAVDLPDIQDISPEEEKEKFDKIKKELMDFADRLEEATIRTIEEGKMTKDLALITSIENPTVLNSEGFIKAVREELDKNL